MKLLQIYKSLGLDFFNFIFPPVCIICSSSGNLLCENCKNKLKEQVHECHVCKKFCDGFIHSECAEFTSLNGVFVPFKYSKIIELIVQDLKYHFHSQTADSIASLILNSNQGKVFEKFIINSNSLNILVPVPLYKLKKNLRGFNQAELIAKNIYKSLKNNVRFKIYHKSTDLQIWNLLKRIKNTKTQVGMNRQERIENLKEVFEINPDFIAYLGKLDAKLKTNDQTERVSSYNNSTFILIDDIYTTGTTMEECSKVLKSYFPNSEVYGIVFARG